MRRKASNSRVTPCADFPEARRSSSAAATAEYPQETQPSHCEHALERHRPSAARLVIPIALINMDTDEHRQGILELVSDEELMQRVVTKEQSAFEQLYRRHYLLLRRIISEKVSSVFDTEEVLQDVFVAVWKSAGNYDPAHGKPLGWVICMARRRAIDHVRKNRRYNTSHVPQSHCADETDTVEHPPFYPSPEQENLVATRDLRQRLTDLIGQLPTEQQHVLKLAYFGDLSHRRIATVTGIPLGTVKTRLELAINKLAKKSEHLREEL